MLESPSVHHYIVTCLLVLADYATVSPDYPQTSFGVIDLVASIIGAFIFLLLLISCTIIVITCMLKLRKSARADDTLQQEESDMRNMVADEEGAPIVRHPASAHSRRNGPSLPSLQFSYALIVPPEEDYSPSFDDPIPDEPPPPYTLPDDSQILQSVQTSSSVASSLPEGNQFTVAGTMDENRRSESES